MNSKSSAKEDGGISYPGAELKRVVGTWGAFAMGYADVGADIYIALGLVALYASYAAPLAVLIAAITYVTTGLSYAELASKYPVAGGAQFYSLKALGELHGFLAGWALMLDYTVDIALFALASVGYLGFLTKTFWNTEALIASPGYGIAAIVLVLTLVALNIVGIRWSSGFNQIFVAMNMLTLAVIIAIGLPFIFLVGSLSNWLTNVTQIGTNPDWNGFAYATTLALVSYIGIESISQAAEETRHPSSIIPKATKAAIASVIVLAATMSLLSVTILSPAVVAQRSQDALVALASRLPILGVSLSLWVALMGFTICYASTNTGVIGVSRVTFSMGRLKLFPSVFRTLHPRFRTPYMTITVFSLAAVLLILVNIFLPSLELLNLIASLYNFGALVAYMYVNLSLILLRNTEPTEGLWKSPFSIKLSMGARRIEIPLLATIGLLSCVVVWLAIVGFWDFVFGVSGFGTHPLGRLLGFIWFLIGFMLYALYRRINRLPILRSRRRVQ